MIKNNETLIRIFLAILVFFCILWGYWWLTWSLIIVFLFYFNLYYEIILWGIMYDAIYGLKLPVFWDIQYVFTISSIILFLIAFYLRKRLIAYDVKN
jgi:hypothetical protein